MLKIRLGEEDRERLGCPEWIEYDPDKFLMSEAEILDEHGIDWERIRYGEPVFDEDGKKVDKVRRYRPGVRKVWVWSALRRAGIAVDLTELEFDLDAVEYEQGREVGKGSPTSGSGSPPPSPASTTSRRKTSAA